jgi:hypothetical protein
MKKRTGFVSNSSSASYIIKLRGSLNEVLSDIANNCDWPYTTLEKIKKELNERIVSLEKRLEELETKKEKYLMFNTVPELKNRIYKERYDLNRIEKIEKEREGDWQSGQEEVTQIALRLNYIKIEEKNEYVELEAATVMHNSYVEGMPDFLKDIVLYYSFENKEMIVDLEVDKSN